MNATPALLRCYSLAALGACIVLLGFVVPISVALDNLLLAVLLLGALFNAPAVWHIAIRNPVARAGWVLFFILFVAMFYGAAPWGAALGTLGKYIDLAFIPMFMYLFSDEQNRRRAQYAFLASMGVTLFLSYLVGMKLLPIQHWMWVGITQDNPAIFHSHIAQNNMMAFVVFLALLNLRESASRIARIFWGSYALLAGINVLFMVQGRTGYMILLALLCWFSWATLARYLRSSGRNWGWKQGAALLLLAAGFVAVAYSVSPRLHDRVSLVKSEYQAWQPNHGKDTSTGQRLDFYYNTLQIVRQHELIGVGTGGFPAAFAEHTQGTTAPKTVNPHNEYLMISVQSGLIGLAALLHLFYTQWRTATQLNTPYRQDAARGLVLAYVVNCAFNSALLDHVDGLFFAFMTAVLFAGLKVVKRG